MWSGNNTLTTAQAYEAAYRFLGQYFAREPASESLMLMLVAMEPTRDSFRTNDPASWKDWQQCVTQTLRGEPLPELSA